MRIASGLAAVVLGVLSTTSVWACPNLAGTYNCTDTDGTVEKLNITQSADDKGITTYVYNGSALPADNAVYAVPDDDSLKDGSLRGWCDDDVTWKTQVLGKYWRNGAYYGDLTLNRGLSLDTSGNLVSVTSGAIVNSAGSHALDSNVTCTRAAPLK